MIGMICDAVCAALRHKRQRQPKPDELFAGVPKPTTILVEMIAADLIKMLPDFEDEYTPPRHPYDETVRTSALKTDWYELVRTTRQRGHYKPHITWRLQTPTIILSDREEKILDKAWAEMSSLKAKKAAAVAEAKNQDNALKAIEKRLGLDTRSVVKAA